MRYFGDGSLMSSFHFPTEKVKYIEVKNIRVLQAMLKDDARKDTTIRINPFKLITYKEYGYIKKIVAQCKYCPARLKFKGRRTETDHFRDQQRLYNDSSNNNSNYEKIVNITYTLAEFNNVHEHNKENTSQLDQKRRNSLRNELILDQYENLMKDNTNQNYIKGVIRKKFNINDKQIYKILHPFEIMQRRYSIYKQKMLNMNFITIQRRSEFIDVNKVKSSYIDFPNQFTIITPVMTKNFIKYGQTVYFGIYPQYVSQSKKLILVGGFYGINQHHNFIPFATIILTIIKKEEQVIVFNNLLDIIDKDDKQISYVLKNIFKTFFEHFNKIHYRNVLLVVRQTINTQQALYQMRKEFPNLNFIYCFREKLNNLELEVNKRYCNDSYSSEEKLDFITSLYSMVKTMEEEEYTAYLKSLFKKANTNNTLLLQKITQDSHLFCFSKIKDSMNNLYEQCVDDYLRKKYQKILSNQIKSHHMFMRNIMNIINLVINQQKNCTKLQSSAVKPAGAIEQCEQCYAYKMSKKQQFFNQTQIFELKIPELKKIRQKVCIKTFLLVLKQLVKCLSIKSYVVLDQYQQRQYFVFKHSKKYKITECEQTNSLKCQCEISKKYGIPCSHELYICSNLGIKIENQLGRWII